MAKPTTSARAGLFRPPARTHDEVCTTVKTTMMFRTIANPRRTTLAHLEDAAAPQTPDLPEHSVSLPAQTANPRRTVLMEVPAAAGTTE
jgi:hypothetical protein